MADAPTAALGLIDAGAVAHVKVDAIPVVVKTAGSYPRAPVSAQRAVVKTAPYPMAPVAPQAIIWVTAGPSEPESPEMPIPVIVVG